MRTPVCHPERAHYSRDLCRSCYEKDLRLRNPEYAERQRHSSRGWAARHPGQKERATADWQKRQSPEWKRERQLRHKYGMTVADFDAMLAAQGGRCALCDRTGCKWNVDHDHATGLVRAILCKRCNCALGWFDDDPDALRRAADYIEHHRLRYEAQQREAGVPDGLAA
jgi:hypothetical protein